MKTFTLRLLITVLSIIGFSINSNAQFGGGDANITAYSFAEQTGDATITVPIAGQNGKVEIEIAYGTNLNGLIATFTLDDGATADVSGTAQESGVTPNDFVEDVALVYTITAEDGTTTQDWDIIVSIAAASADKDFIDYNLPYQIGDESISTFNHTIDVTVASGTDVTALVADFVLSDNATTNISGVDQTSGTTVNNFTNPVIYTTVAQDGSTQDWTITVTISTSANTEAKITAYSFAEQTGDATITDPVYSGANGTIDIEVAYGTDLSALIASFELSYGASANISGVDQVSGTTANNFTNLVTYTVTAEDGSTTVDWDINVSIAQNIENDILAYSFAEQTEDAIIDANNHTVNIEVTNGTDVTALVATFSLSGDANANISGTAQESTVTENDFTNPVTYTIVAQNGDAQDWIVTVNIATIIRKQTSRITEIYPNPANNFIIFRNFDSTTENIQIIDITGKLIKQISILENNQSIDISDLKNGIYFVKYKNTTTKLIKK